MMTVAFTPSSAAANATPGAWWPALAATTPRARSSSLSREIRRYPPRALNEPVRCRFSHLRNTGPPTRSDRTRECSIGVGGRMSRSTSRAAATSSALTEEEVIAMPAVSHSGHDAQDPPARRSVKSVQPDNDTHAADGTPPRPAATTLGEPRASGHEFETVKEDLRRDLLAMIRGREETMPGSGEVDQTVLPHV